MIMLSLHQAQYMGLAVGRAPNVAMTTPGHVVFVDDTRKSWTDASTREASAMVDWGADRLLAPPFRIWRLREHGFAHNCHECGRIIVPGDPRWLDEVSGHIARHVECHEKAEAGK